MKITVPELSLVVLIGPSGCGKSSFARKNFKPTEVLSSDYCRGLLSDDETNQAATTDAFELLHFIAKSKRGLVQPAVKCRGREYLRIIYGFLLRFAQARGPGTDAVESWKLNVARWTFSTRDD